MPPKPDKQTQADLLNFIKTVEEGYEKKKVPESARFPLSASELKKNLNSERELARYERAKNLSERDVKQLAIFNELTKREIDAEKAAAEARGEEYAPPQLSNAAVNRCIHSLIKLDGTPEAEEFNRALVRLDRTDLGRDAITLYVQDRLRAIDYQELAKTFRDDDKLLDYYESHALEAIALANEKSLSSLYHNCLKYNDEFIKQEGENRTFYEGIGGHIKSRMLIMSSPLHFIFNDPWKQGVNPENSYQIYSLNKNKEFEPTCTHLSLLTLGDPLDVVMQKAEKAGAKITKDFPFDLKPTLTGKGGEVKPGTLLAVSDPKKAVSFETRSAEELKAVVSIVPDAERERVKEPLAALNEAVAKYEEKHAMRERANEQIRSLSIESTMKKNSMFFRFMQSTEYSNLETAAAAFDRAFKENGMTEETRALLGDLRTKAELYKTKKGEPDQKKDPRGFARVAFVKELLEKTAPENLVYPEDAAPAEKPVEAEPAVKEGGAVPFPPDTFTEKVTEEPAPEEEQIGEPATENERTSSQD